MKVTCPKNPKHKTFITTAHVMQEWIVNEHGEFNRVHRDGECLEVIITPDPEEVWTCYFCGAEAKVKVEKGEQIWQKKRLL